MCSFRRAGQKRIARRQVAGNAASGSLDDTVDLKLRFASAPVVQVVDKRRRIDGQVGKSRFLADAGNPSEFVGGALGRRSKRLARRRKSLSGRIHPPSLAPPGQNASSPVARRRRAWGAVRVRTATAPVHNGRAESRARSGDWGETAPPRRRTGSCVARPPPPGQHRTAWPAAPPSTAVTQPQGAAENAFW